MASYTLRLNQPTAAGQHHHHHHHHHQVSSGNFFNTTNSSGNAVASAPGDLLAVNTYLERFSSTPMIQSYQPDVVMTTSEKLGNFYMNNNNSNNNNSASGIVNASVTGTIGYQRSPTTIENQSQPMHQHLHHQSSSDYFLPYLTAGSHHHHQQQTTLPSNLQPQQQQQQQQRRLVRDSVEAYRCRKRTRSPLYWRRVVTNGVPVPAEVAEEAEAFRHKCRRRLTRPATSHPANKPLPPK